MPTCPLQNALRRFTFVQNDHAPTASTRHPLTGTRATCGVESQPVLRNGALASSVSGSLREGPGSGFVRHELTSGLLTMPVAHSQPTGCSPLTLANNSENPASFRIPLSFLDSWSGHTQQRCAPRRKERQFEAQQLSTTASTCSIAVTASSRRPSEGSMRATTRDHATSRAEPSSRGRGRSKCCRAA